jgi:carbon monoxide dehydrogenase subunit G
MAIEIRETFQVAAPIDAVWRFVMDPNKIVTCMPGAKLVEIVDDRTFDGSIKIKVGAISTSYKGRIQLTEVDEQAYKVQMAAEGRETSGGMAKGTMQSSLQSLPDGQTEMVIEASVDLTGRIMQVGRGMIQGVSHQLFLQFVKRTKEHLENAPAEAKGASEGTTAPADQRNVPSQEDDEALSIVPLILKAIWSAIAGFFQRLFGR